MDNKIRIDSETGLYIEVVHPLETGDDIIETPSTESFYLPKWNGETWEEGATQEYINNLKAQAEPQEPTESERLEALEMLMVDILGGGF